MNSPRPIANPSASLALRWGGRFIVLAALVVTAYFVIPKIWPANANMVDSAVAHKIQITTLRDTVIERGTLESQSTIDGICQLHGYRNKITFLVEEGATVQKGDVVVRFDNSEITQRVAAQKIKVTNAEKAVTNAEEQLELQKNKNESDIAAAEMAKNLADLDLKKYIEGDYIEQLAEADRSIAESKARLAQMQQQLKNTRVLVKKGFREPEQLRELEQTVKSAQFQVDRDIQRKEILVKFDHQRKITELESTAKETGRKLTRAKSNAKSELLKANAGLDSARRSLEIEQAELKEDEEQLTRCEITAPHSGTVAYANSRWMDPEFKIRQGGVGSPPANRFLFARHVEDASQIGCTRIGHQQTQGWAARRDSNRFVSRL